MLIIMSNDTALDDKKIKGAKEVEEDFDASDYSSGDTDNVSEELLMEMIRAGLWYGRNRTKTHPKMRPYIFTNRTGIEIIDIAKTSQALDIALEFLKGVVLKGGRILFVGTQPSAKHRIEEITKKFGQPYVVNRWLGGTLTNFTTLSKRVDHFKKLKADRASGALAKYTKKEQSDFKKEIDRLATLFTGVEEMARLPEAVFVVNSNIHETAVREANKIKIPVVGVISTDTDPDFIQYPIPANDSATSSVNWILDRVDKAITEALGVAAAKTAELIK